MNKQQRKRIDNMKALAHYNKQKEERKAILKEEAKVRLEESKPDLFTDEVTDEEMHIMAFMKELSDGSMFIRDWDALDSYMKERNYESETHTIEIRRDMCNAGLHCKNPIEYEYKSEVPWEERMPNESYLYLSTHTFYGMSYKGSTKMLRACGFNVTINNWDAKRCPL